MVGSTLQHHLLISLEFKLCGNSVWGLCSNGSILNNSYLRRVIYYQAYLSLEEGCSNSRLCAFDLTSMSYFEGPETFLKAFEDILVIHRNLGSIRCFRTILVIFCVWGIPVILDNLGLFWIFDKVIGCLDNLLEF